jgi:hypothetical protein
MAIFHPLHRERTSVLEMYEGVRATAIVSTKGSHLLLHSVLSQAGLTFKDHKQRPLFKNIQRQDITYVTGQNRVNSVVKYRL